MTTPLLPQTFWFRLAVPCQRIDALPRPDRGGKRLDLPASCLLPGLAALDGKDSWASVRAAWNPAGLALQFEAKGSKGPDANRPEGFDDVQVWVDTRDTRNVSRATRFCHRFTVRLLSAGPRSALGVTVAQRTIARAMVDAPMSPVGLITAAAERLRDGWRLELFLPAAALQGFDPETNRRLGFAYQVSDPNRDDQFLAVGREFPIGENPSLWSTLELRD